VVNGVHLHYLKPRSFIFTDMASLFGSLFVFVCLAASAITATAPLPPYYIITNAETPSLNRPGLTPVGKQRAEDCIPAVSFLSYCILVFDDLTGVLATQHRFYPVLQGR
jgi:hypothetical protein